MEPSLWSQKSTASRQPGSIPVIPPPEGIHRRRKIGHQQPLRDGMGLGRTRQHGHQANAPAFVQKKACSEQRHFLSSTRAEVR
jgi:hypothetical protein